MATRYLRWSLCAMLAVGFAGFAQDKAEKLDDKGMPKEKGPTSIEDLDALDAKAPHAKERARGTVDPCKMTCVKTTTECAQRCNAKPVEGDDPDAKDQKKYTKQGKLGDADKCVAKCGQTQLKCIGACK